MPTPVVTGARLLTIDQAARALALSRSTLYRLVRSGDLRTVRIAGKHRIRPRDLDRYLDALQRTQREKAVNFS